MNPLHVFLEKLDYFLLSYFLENIGSTARKKRVDYGKTRIFSRCSYEGENSLFYPRKEHILLRLAPAMDLIEKENRLSSFGEVSLRLCNNLYNIFFFGEDS